MLFMRYLQESRLQLMPDASPLVACPRRNPEKPAVAAPGCRISLFGRFEARPFAADRLGAGTSIEAGKSSSSGDSKRFEFERHSCRVEHGLEVSEMALKSGVLKLFDSGTYLATVQLPGSLSTWLTDVPVSRSIAAAEMVAGRRVALLSFDEGNPKDAVLVAVWS
jgi:hypothetical protein